jgi:hypothetical protein
MGGHMVGDRLETGFKVIKPACEMSLLANGSARVSLMSFRHNGPFVASREATVNRATESVFCLDRQRVDLTDRPSIASVGPASRRGACLDPKLSEDSLGMLLDGARPGVEN